MLPPEKMRSKLLNIALLLSSFLGYLEWGGGNHMFLIEGEIDIISKLFSDPVSVIHPFIVLPLIGQILLMITLFQRTPSKLLTYLGMGSIGILLWFILIVGLIGLHVKTLGSVIPFLILNIWVIGHHRNKKHTGQEDQD